MKKVLSTVALTGLVLAGTNCFAADGMYVKGILEYVMPADPSIDLLNTDTDNGFGWGGAFGYTIDQFRVEGAITTQNWSIV